MAADDEETATSRSVPPGGKMAVDGDIMLPSPDKSRSMFSMRPLSPIGLDVIMPSEKEDITPFTVGITDEIAVETPEIMLRSVDDMGILLCWLSKAGSCTVDNGRATGALRGCYYYMASENCKKSQ